MQNADIAVIYVNPKCWNKRLKPIKRTIRNTRKDIDFTDSSKLEKELKKLNG